MAAVQQPAVSQTPLEETDALIQRSTTVPVPVVPRDSVHSLTGSLGGASSAHRLLIILSCCFLLAVGSGATVWWSLTPSDKSVDERSECWVEDGVGYWNTTAPLHWYVHPPSECALYPFIAIFLQILSPPQFPPWPARDSVPTALRWLPFTVSPSPSDSGLPTTHVEFLRSRYFLWLSDSVDRLALEWFCVLNNSTNIGPPNPYYFVDSKFHPEQHFWQYTEMPQVGRQGLRACYIAALNLSLFHAQTFGVLWDDTSPQSAIDMLNQRIPAYVQLAALKLGHPGVDRVHVSNSSWNVQLCNPAMLCSVLICEENPIPDVIVLHSCAWDWDWEALNSDNSDQLVFSLWMKAFEMRMLIPSLERYSHKYRAWQWQFLKHTLNESLTGSAHGGDSDMQLLRERLFVTVPNPSDSFSPAPCPRTHTFPSKTIDTPPACHNEPLFVFRTCPPLRDDADRTVRRHVARTRINRAIYVLAHHYGIRVLDLNTMLDGSQSSPGIMYDYIHWGANPTYQGLNVLFNMYRQHQLREP